MYQVIERTVTADGQILLLPDIEIAAYWTSLTASPDDVLPWNPDHGTMEQYHSEVKTDMELERLPSGKFATNPLVLQLGVSDVQPLTRDWPGDHWTSGCAFT